MPVKPFYPSNNLPPLTRFRDLVIFDERIKQNYHTLSKVKRRHEILFVSISVSLICYVIHWIFFDSSSSSLVLSSLSILFLVACIVALVILVLLQLYNNKLLHSNKFEKQIKKDLEMYNMTFNATKNEALGFSKRIPKKWQEIFFLYRDEYRRRKLTQLMERKK